jgi:protein SCO1/2
MKKFIFLILTLAIPVSIFLFLKIFGNNEFEVPVLFEDGLPECGDSGQPHRITPLKFMSSSGATIDTQDMDGFLIFCVFEVADTARLDEYIIQLVRIQDAFYEIGSPTFVLLSEEKGLMSGIITKTKDIGLQAKHYQLGYLGKSEFSDFFKCGLGLTSAGSANLVVADPERRIRGLYDVMDLEQTEQLILELKILRKQV